MRRSCSHEVLSYTACMRQKPTEALLGASSDKCKPATILVQISTASVKKGATDRQSRFFISDDQIDDRMIDLPNVVRPFRVEAAGARGHFGLQRNLAPPSCGSQSIVFVNAALDGAAMRRREPLDSTSFVHALDQGAHFRLFFFQPEAVDLLAD